MEYASDVNDISYDDALFRQHVDKALASVRLVLDNNRSPTFPSEVPHSYDDKFLLSTVLLNSSLAGIRNALAALGLDEAGLLKLKEWATKGNSSVTLRHKAEQRCVFLKVEDRKIESDTVMHVNTTERSGWRAGKKTSTDSSKTITIVKEWSWRFEHTHSISVFPGNKPELAIELQRRASHVELLTRTDASPKPEMKVFTPVDVNITLLVKLMGAAASPADDAEQLARQYSTFTINRSHPKCHTPTNNPEVTELLRFYLKFGSWCGTVREHFMHTFDIQLQPSACNGDTVLDISMLQQQRYQEFFVPVLALFEDKASQEASRVLPIGDVATIMKEHKRCIDEKLASFGKTFAGKNELISTLEVSLCFLLWHMHDIMASAINGALHVEDLLRKQIVAAIGKWVGAADIGEYMRFHDRKLFAKEYAPRAFHYDIRRAPGYAPEGSLSIEADGANDGMRPINTYARLRDAGNTHPMQFSLNAATKVTFRGPHVLHGYVQHSFSGEGAKQVQLVARARQFSSYILLVGKIAAADLFEPLHGIIVQNKDEVLIPLLMTPLPTPKEFKDAIESLSPEQQRFAKAFRAMQLESTLFAMCVVQIKPQMERLLRLPGGALAKEIRLTQDLMKLFIEYQVPSDLLTYEGPEHSPIYDKLQAVKAHVTAVNSMITDAKEQEIEDQKQVARSAILDRAAESDAYDGRLALADCGLVGGGMELELCKSSALCELQEECVSLKSSAKEFKSKGRLMKSESLAPKGSMLMAKKSRKREAPRMMPGSAGPSLGAASGAGAVAVRRASGQASTTINAPSAAAGEAAAPVVMHEVLREKGGQQGQGGQAGGVEHAACQEDGVHEGFMSPPSDVVVVDYTQVPAALDRQFEALDKDAALRPTTVTVGDCWTKQSSKRLVSADKPTTTMLYEAEQKAETNRCMDLLDALSRSGDLELHDCVLHVLVAATHCFDQTVMDTLVKSNINPVERIERSALIVSSTVHQCPVPALLADDAQRQRVMLYSPVLFGHEGGDGGDEGGADDVDELKRLTEV